MEDLNYYILFLAALIPLAVGAVYYAPPVLGNTWMKVSGTTEAQIQSSNMILIFGLSYLFGLFISAFMMGYAIHQFNVPSLFVNAEKFGVSAAEGQTFIENFLEKYGHLHRTFSHGAVHGGFATILFALPLIAINALFERRGWKYVAVHFGYWFITLILMGGVICAYI